MWFTMQSQSYVPTLKGSEYKIYDMGRKSPSWELDLDFENICNDNLSSRMKDIAFKTACNQAYIEQIGQISAAQLLVKAKDPEIRFALSRSVADESRHAEIFAKYAMSLIPVMDNPNPGMLEVADEVSRSNDFDHHIMLHVILENYALEQFSMYGEIFKDFLLGKLYLGSRNDESRHVAVGMSYLKRRAKQGVSIENKLYAYEKEILAGPGNFPKEAVVAMAQLLDCSVDEVEKKMKARHQNFRTQIFSRG